MEGELSHCHNKTVLDKRMTTLGASSADNGMGHTEGFKRPKGIKKKYKTVRAIFAQRPDTSLISATSD